MNLPRTTLRPSLDSSGSSSGCSGQAQDGRTVMEITRIGLGTAFLLGLDKINESLPYKQVVRAALDQGINFIDTAALYGRGQAPRDRFVIQTKAGRYANEGGGSFYDYSRDGILRSVENSLKALKIDRLDSVLVHDADADHFNSGGGNVRVEGTYFQATLDLREEGVISATGAGMNQWQMEWEFAKRVDVDCFLLAGRYTLLEQTSLDFLEHCQQKNIAILLGGVFNSSILVHGTKGRGTYNYAPPSPAIMEKVKKIEAVCERHNVPLRVAAPHFAMAHPAVTAVVLGAQKPEEVKQNVEATTSETEALDPLSA